MLRRFPDQNNVPPNQRPPAWSAPPPLTSQPPYPRSHIAHQAERRTSLTSQSRASTPHPDRNLGLHRQPQRSTLKHLDASFCWVARGLILPLTVLLSTPLALSPRCIPSTHPPLLHPHHHRNSSRHIPQHRLCALCSLVTTLHGLHRHQICRGLLAPNDPSELWCCAVADTFGFTSNRNN